MKIFTLWTIALLLAVSVKAEEPQLAPVTVKLGLQKFELGDSIVIREVLATSPRMDVGDTVVVLGRYELQSQERASIGLSLTKTQNRKPTKISPGANSVAERGSGYFEVTLRVVDIGCLHLTFSSLSGGKSFGTLYFGTPEQLERVRDMRW